MKMTNCLTEIARTETLLDSFLHSSSSENIYLYAHKKKTIKITKTCPDSLV